MRKIYLLPNLFTTASLFCGLLAILNIFNVQEAPELETYRYNLSCYLILLAAILDALDGWVARMTKTESNFGMQYDSLADLVAFGVAPAALIYTRLSMMQNRHAAEVITTLYVICGALRLARFNIQQPVTGGKAFIGLPIPAAAGVVVSGFLFFQQIDPFWDRAFVLKILPLLMIVLSYLMVSNIRYASFKQLELERRKPFSVLPILVLVIALGVALQNSLAAVAFAGFVIYVAIGVIAHIVRLAGRNISRSRNAAPTSPTGPS